MKLRSIAVSAVAVALTATLAACGGGSSSSDAASWTSAEDAGGLDALVEAAKAEGELNVIALPRDWANYGEVIDGFKAKYPEITVNELSPDVSSAEELAAVQGRDTDPDVFDIGASVAFAPENAEKFAPYKNENWDDVSDAIKEGDGLYVGDYGGYMSLGYDSSKVPAITSLDDLLGSDFKGKVALNGSAVGAGAGFSAYLMIALANGGTLDDTSQGLEFIKKVNDAGNLIQIDPTTDTIVSGQTPVVFNWDYLNSAISAQLPTWKTFIPDGVAVAGYYYQAISASAPHPAAARLWQEWLYSDEVQNMWLKGGARPARAEAMDEAGTIDAALYAALPQVSGTPTSPNLEQTQAIVDYLNENWANEIK